MTNYSKKQPPIEAAEQWVATGVKDKDNPRGCRQRASMLHLLDLLRAYPEDAPPLPPSLAKPKA